MYAQPTQIFWKFTDEKLKFLHAVSGAIVEKTAYLLGSHFQRFVNTHHTALFPHNIQRLHQDYAIPNRRFRCGHRPQPASAAADLTASDGGSSQCSASALPLPLLSSIASNTEGSVLPPHTRIPPLAPRAGRDGLRPRTVPRDYVSMSQNGLM